MLLQATGVIQGLAFGVLFLNSSAAIVAYFVLPTALNIVGMLWKDLKEIQPWIDLWTSQTPLFMGGEHLQRPVDADRHQHADLGRAAARASVWSACLRAEVK